MRRQLCILILLMTGPLVLSVNFTSPNQVLRGSSTVSAATQNPMQVNLALNKPATQSSTDTNNDASRAVDGDPGTFSQTRSETSANQAWWEVDLGALGFIDKVEIYNRTDCCSGVVRRYYVFVSDVPFSSRELGDTINQPEVTSEPRQFRQGGDEPFKLGRIGRYVRVQLDADNSSNYSLHLVEVKVLGTPLATAPKIVGQWSAEPDFPDIPVHISLLPSRKLLFWGRDKREDGFDVERSTHVYLWDPNANTFTRKDHGTTNLFCSGHSFLPNGDLFVAGGAETPIDNSMNKRHDVEGHGPRQTNIFDYRNEVWLPGPSMNLPRWYPSVVTLHNGETLVVSGDYVNGFNGNAPIHLRNKDTEILDVNRTLRRISNDFPVALTNYPLLHLAPDGNVITVSRTVVSELTRAIDDRNGLYYDPFARRWFDSPDHDPLDLTEDHELATSVIYDKSKIMVIGGKRSPTNVSKATEVLDLSLPPWNWRWVAGAAMNFPRYYATSVLMPDGQVFIVGGSKCGGDNNIRTADNLCTGGAIMNPEIYNPGTGVWSIMARQQFIRVYHSVALLMPDARILVAGGGRPGAVGEMDADGIITDTSALHARHFAHKEVQIFSPPYLFNSNGAALRPAITNDPSNITYGLSFSVEIGTVPASQIGQVVLVRLPSVTHGLNFDQRRVVLSKTPVGEQTLSVTAPANGNECPPGPYMLFVIGQDGVPSVAKMVFVEAPLPCQIQPPSGAVATAVSNSRIDITWTPPEGPVDHYDVERSQNISGPFTIVGTTSTTQFSDTNVAGSVAYLYRVRAVCSGSPSPPSNMDVATAMNFMDSPLIAGVTVVKAQQINELRVAVNAVRATAGLPLATWIDTSLPGVPVKAIHINELRQNLNQALQTMGFAAPSYTDPSLSPGLMVKKVHIEEIRQATR